LNVITPTVGRIVWFYKYVAGQGHKGPTAAIVTTTHGDTMVSICTFPHGRDPVPISSVRLVQDDAEIPEFDYCAWMPYQKGQAAKTEALEKQVSGK
jgi:hypothetical protein